MATHTDREYRAYAKGDSWKLNLEISIDECMAQARSREHFIRLMEYSGYEVRWEDTRKYITYTTPDGHKCRDIKLNGLKYHKEVMEHEFRIRQEICRRNAAGAAGYDLESGSGAAYGSRDGAELGSHDRFAEIAGRHAGKMREEFGNAISREQERMKNTSKKLFWISMIPSLILVVWKLTRHIWLLG